ncbi:MAG: hypothetical protein E4G99_01885 [Anaerolineales bacterium]|nr:MAG: hypothetical protein E4G99_01885 [Anaerolineales bacterium]
MPSLLQSLLHNPTISRIRRNHGLEHATIHLLSQRHPQRTFIGRSDAGGFTLFGEVETSTLRELVLDALARLRRGEHQLAIHPNCGTNLVTSALLAGGASFFALTGSEREGWLRRLERLPNAILLSMGALLIAQPLGRAAQKHMTVQADPQDLEVLGIHRMGEEPRPIHRIITAPSYD